MAEDTKLHVKIHSPFRTYFDGNAASVSAVNDTGPFDILPEHHRFMTILNAGEVVVRNEENSMQRYKIDRGIMHVRGNQVTVFLDV
ncbi:MAG TPA: hypothetical protein VFX86_00370 [Candidatus Saccharimonadales bacterium]|nr:hypothetical protein [Candidatus Saccharimonadales bacterium]